MAPERGGGAAGGGRSLRGGPEGLPEAFLQSLRPLFDILDDRRRGYIHLREIESRWRQQECTGAEAGQLPRGVLEGLRRAAPPSGYLTFERFVLGLRASLLSPEKGGSPAEGTGKIPGRSADASCGVGRSGGGSAAASRSREKLPGGSGVEQAHSKRAAADGGRLRKLAGQGENHGKAEGRRQPRGRGEHRRHTITNGVDYSLLKQMKELEKEKDFLLQGLEMVERVREWYQHQLLLLQERQRQLGKSKLHSDLLSEGNPHTVNHLFPKLQDLNRCLCELLRLSAQPMNSSCATANSPSCKVAPSPPLARPEQTIHMLKEQNRLLTKEVTDKSDRITQLEQEKSSLIKQLFEARAHGTRDAGQLDSTFI